MRYVFSCAKIVYYISDLNETSMALAHDILDKNEGRRPLIVFFNVFSSEDPAHVELIDEARTLGAVLFGKDITEVVNAIRKTGCPVLGSVLNNVDFRSFTSRNHYYKSERYASYYKRGYTAYDVQKHAKK